MKDIRNLWPVGIPGDQRKDEWMDMEFFRWPDIDSTSTSPPVEKRTSLFTLFHKWSLLSSDFQSDNNWIDLVMDQCLIDSANLAQEDCLEVSK
jgi:hypothetical protein